MPAASVSGATALQYTSNRPSMLQRTASQGGAGAPLQKRVRSKRGENRNENNRVPGGQGHRQRTDNVDNPEEEEIESLCKLLATVGSMLDTQKARAHLDVYFSQMKELTKSLNVTPRMQYMLQDLLELRERKWVAHNAVAAPTTIAQIHETVRMIIHFDISKYLTDMSRGGSRHGGDRGDFSQQTGPDGWAVAGSGSRPPRPPPKAGDLSNFGKISKAQPLTFGPSSVFAGKKGAENKREAILRGNSSSNMFSMLSSQGAEASDKDKAATEPPPQSKCLVLQPHSVPVETTSPAAKLEGSCVNCH
ncbi:hypothetical protein BYT27DRAFT_7262064 [Phlegmacium glaucopus]|nr:hypothetical protein BYT27DRAFT_7262064 [Phlegmacium glaucopus]